MEMDLDDPRYQRFLDLLLEVEGLDPAGRKEFLERECEGDPELRAEIEAHLSLEGKAQDLAGGSMRTGSEVPGSHLSKDPLLSQVPEFQGFKILDPCVLYHKIGEGGMGAVFRAGHLDFEIEVAVKCMLLGRRSSRSSSSLFVRRFRKEAQAAATVSHQNLVRVFGVDFQHQIHFMVMEYVEGETARERVRRKGPLPVAEAATIILGAARGLAAAHSAGIVHRDVKPDNLLISRRGEVKVADLGLARTGGSVDEARNAPSGLGPGAALGSTLSREVLGTPPYMPPEQWRGIDKVEASGDVWALGATFYFLLAGRDALHGESLEELRQKVWEEEFPEIRKERSEVPEELARIIAGCTKRPPQFRYATARRLFVDLRKVVESQKLISTLVDPSMPEKSSQGDADRFPSTEVMDRIRTEMEGASGRPRDARHSRGWRSGVFLAAGMALVALLVLGGLSILRPRSSAPVLVRPPAAASPVPPATAALPTPLEAMALGDGWWDLARVDPGILERDKLLRVADSWYRKALLDIGPGPGEPRWHLDERTAEIRRVLEYKDLKSRRNSILKDAIMDFTFDALDVDAGSGKQVVRDLSGKGHDGNVKGVTLAPGKVGNGLNLDGLGNYLTGSVDGLPLRAQPKTLVLWLKVTQESLKAKPNPKFPEKNVFSNSWIHNLLIYDDGRIAFGSCCQEGDLVKFRRGIADGQWHHVATVLEGEDRKFFRVYFEGLEDTVVEVSKIFDKDSTGRSWTIGCYGEGGASDFDGMIDEFAYFNRALSPEEIKVLYLCGELGIDLKKEAADRLERWEDLEFSRDAIDRDALLLLTFDSYTWERHASRTTIHDQSQMGNEPVVARPGVRPVAGVAGEGAEFNGQGVLKGSGLDFPLPQEEWTLSLWIKTFEPPQQHTLRSLFFFRKFQYLDLEGGVPWAKNCCDIPGAIVSANSNIGDGEWHHLVTVMDVAEPRTVRIYVDGLEENSSPAPRFVDPGHNDEWFMGDYGTANSEDYRESIDEVALSRRALTPKEVFSLYDRGRRGLGLRD